MWDFILERYNYWVVIMLMMIGLYIVISRGNLVKTLVGLNLFQTSVFVFYISMARIAGGTAPIYTKADYKARLKEGLSEEQITHISYKGNVGHHEEAGYGDDGGYDAVKGEGDVGVEGTSLHDGDAVPSNDLSGMMGEQASSEIATNQPMPDLHDVPNIGPETIGPEMAATGPGFAAPADAAYETLPDVIPSNVGDVIYSNPLPHVLILTAIVVGVATTAVGLALAVRIREAYGTIEEDELEAADNIAEFGRPQTKAAGSVG
jgi:multicomponent Na+:H+ antiporter subunit C